jgi:hypothetical protein
MMPDKILVANNEHIPESIKKNAPSMARCAMKLGLAAAAGYYPLTKKIGQLASPWVVICDAPKSDGPYCRKTTLQPCSKSNGVVTLQLS